MSSKPSRAGASMRARLAVVGRLSICVAVTVVASCGDQYNSIYRTARLDGPGGGISLITDAKQRVVINVDDYRPGRDKNHRIICAEPSPDVAQATSTALQVSANLASTAGSSKTDAAAGLALATAAQVAQLGERLATIQAIRERMYRACEAYANGATNSAQYRNMLATVDRLMATTLSVEMAAGAFGRSLAVAGTQAGAGGDPAQMKELSAKIEKATADLEAVKDKPEEVTKKLEEIRRLTNQLAGAVGAFAGASSTQAGGGLSGARPADAAAVVAIHRNYVDDERIESLVDACVSTLTELRYADDDYKKYLKSIAEERQRLWAKYTRSPTLAESLSGRNPDEAMKVERERAMLAFDNTARMGREDFLKSRTEFAKYCMTSIFGEVPKPQTTGRPPVPQGVNVIPPIAPYLIHRMRAKENLRRISESTTLASLCFPIIARSRAAPGDADLKAQANYCIATMKY